jgi:hypothetical protein
VFSLIKKFQFYHSSTDEGKNFAPQLNSMPKFVSLVELRSILWQRVIKTETSLRLNRALVQTENSSHVHDTYSQPVCIFLTQIVSKQDRKIRLLSLVNFAKWRKMADWE